MCFPKFLVENFKLKWKKFVIYTCIYTCDIYIIIKGSLAQKLPIYERHLSKVKSSRVESSRVESSRVESSRVESSRVESSRIVSSRVESSRVGQVE